MPIDTSTSKTTAAAQVSAAPELIAVPEVTSKSQVTTENDVPTTIGAPASHQDISTSQVGQSQKSKPQDHRIKCAGFFSTGDEDLRFVEPLIECDQKHITKALEFTRLDYLALVGEEPPQTSPHDSYATRYSELQAALAARWVGPEPVPDLTRLEAWITCFAEFPLPELDLSDDQLEEMNNPREEYLPGIFSGRVDEAYLQVHSA